MKYDTTQLPLGSVARAKTQLDNLDLIKALKTCRNGGVELQAVETELDTCIEHLFAKKNYGVILSAYYRFGSFGSYTVDQLLRLMYEAGDYPSFLKQAYRFNAYQAHRSRIDEAVDWHTQRGLPDAEAWGRKFAKLHEQELLRDTPIEPGSYVSIEEEPLEESCSTLPRVFTLKPMVTQPAPPRTQLPQPADDDPYIVSVTARVKQERANAAHEHTLRALKKFLHQHGLFVAENKLIDAYSVLDSGPAIFEVKSITEGNERSQIRHALSQLYEYRYLHNLPEATLWTVFSQALSAEWYLEYLKEDRGVHVIWLQRDQFQGDSLRFLH